MENMTLEQELTARIFVHKVAVVGGVLMKDYIDRQHGEVNSPEFTVEEQADQYSNEVIQKAMANGTFEDLYHRAWESIKDTLDENTKVI